jgi:dipeptidyl aminopeptidase/acylaminoacyl peptidase
MVRGLLLVALAGVSLCAAMPAAADCASQLLPHAADGNGPITARSLVELLDFGLADSSLGGDAPFSVSPDGRWAAMAMRRADPDTDSYCIGILLVPLDSRRPPRLLDVGGEFIAMTHDVRDAPDIVNGSPDPGTPLWSPDCSQVAYLRRDGGSTQVWIAGLDGKPARKVTRLASDVVAFEWSRDGRAILAKSRPALVSARAAIDREGRTGFLFDKRFWTVSDDRPRPVLPVPVTTLAIDIATGGSSAVPEGTADDDKARPRGALLYARSSGGATAWTGSDDPALFLPPATLHVALAGRDLACPPSICGDHIGALWWTGPTDLLFMRGGSPDNGGRTILYRWQLGHDRTPVALLDTADALFGCQPAGTRFVCARESATRPRTLVLVDPATGATTTLFDPNPDFASRRIGQVRRLVWSRNGVTTYGDLVLPPDHRPGEHHPLIVVQYTSRGFLRGGTGNEVPIHLLAARGFAVLSFQRPGPLAAGKKAKGLLGYERIAISGWAERRMIFEALDAGVDAAIATGAVDPARIGITGLSDGASTTQYALLHSERFKAAALGDCCEDPGMLTVAGLSYRDAVLGWGYPMPGASEEAFWRPYSLALNAGRMKTPLLLQVADVEYRLALETYSALQLHGAPVEMYVFPDEHHVKWHPAHRLAAYERYAAWFDFWLNGQTAGDSARLPEIRRWEKLREQARSSAVDPAAAASR